MAWVILVCAGLLEIVWATALKQSDGLSRLWPSVIGIGGAVLSFALLAVALRQLPAGTGYAVGRNRRSRCCRGRHGHVL